MRIYDPRVGRFLSVDSLTKRYPELTPYQFASNSPISGIDLDGLEYANAMTKAQETWYGKAAFKTLEFSGAFAKVIVNTIAAATELPAQAHYGNKIKREAQADAFPLTNGQNIKDLAVGTAAAPVFAIGGVLEDPKSATKWGELAGTVVLFKGLIKERIAPEEIIRRGTADPKVKAAVDLGNRIHYDRLNGGTGEALPTELSRLYPETQFRFTRRGQAGADVEVTGGTHPSQYPGSTWDSKNNYGDFKPNTPSGKYKFNSEIKSGKLPKDTQKLNYDPKTGKLQ